MSQGHFRLIIPIALLRGNLHYHTGRKDSVMMKALLEVVEVANGSISSLQTGMGLPGGVIDALIASAVRAGFLTLQGERIVLTDLSSNALRESRMDSLFRGETTSERCEWAMDLFRGLTHDFDWILANRKIDSGLGDVVLEPEINADKTTALTKEKRLGDLIRVSSQGQLLTNREAEPRITIENIDRIDGVEVEEQIEVAVPVTENHSGEVTRWLLPHNAPGSIIDLLIQKKPELFAIKYELKETGERWAPTQASVLLERIDRLWEKVQNGVLPRTTFQDRTELAHIALDEVKRWRASWNEERIPYSDIKSIDTWSGPGSEQGRELSKFMKRVRKRVVILTSFLNRKYVSWIGGILSSLPKNAKVLILYGHANEETPGEQEAEAKAYRDELLRYLRSDILLSVSPTTRRTHEKIVISDTSNCMVGSWNICSSNPNSAHLEVNVDLESRSVATELCSVLEAYAIGQDAEFIKVLCDSLEKTNGRKGDGLERQLDSLVWLAETLAKKPEGEALRGWRQWRIQLLRLRDLLWTHFDSPPVAVVTTENLRDAFVEQIRASTRSLLITTDRVNFNGLDASLVQHLFERERLIRIMWGMESPEWDFSDEHEVQEELDIATDTLRAVVKHSRGNVLTSLKPMLNHSKVLIVDENRALISSTNFLARGTEPKEDSSREIGILIESPLIARQLLGRLMLHSEPLRGNIMLRQLAGQPWDLFELVRQTVEELWEDKEIEHPGRPDLVSFAVKSRFREFTQEGRIVGDDQDQYRPIDVSLSNRWENCLTFLGKGRIKAPSGFALPIYEENFYMRVCEMVGIQRRWSERSYTIHPRLRGTFVLPLLFPRKQEKSAFPAKVGSEKGLRQSDEIDIQREMAYNLWIGRTQGRARSEMPLESSQESVDL